MVDCESQSPVRCVDPAEGARDRILLHFPAHIHGISALALDSAGGLILTSDQEGRSFHVFRLLPHLAGSIAATAHHLYVLARGETSARVTHMSFAQDARWLSVTTLRGTVHIFPISPYGGCPTARTHLAPRVVNRLSR